MMHDNVLNLDFTLHACFTNITPLSDEAPTGFKGEIDPMDEAQSQPPGSERPRLGS